MISGKYSHVNSKSHFVGFIPTSVISRYTASMNNQAPTPTARGDGQPPAALLRALHKLLRPLVRLMLHYQITYPYLQTVLKSLYVEVAEKEFGVPGRRQSDSRINLLTGIHRKDVKRLRNEAVEAAQTPENISIGAQLIAHWMASEAFVDKAGKPRALPVRRKESTGNEPGFEELVEIVCKKDIRPRVVLDNWLHLGIAHMDEADRVVLNTGAFTPADGFDEKAFFFGKNLHDHIEAGSHNLRGEMPSHFDRSVYYDRLSATSVAELRALADAVGMQALRQINQRALELQQGDAATEKPADYRINFGIFNYNNRYRDNNEASRAAAEVDSPGEASATAKGNHHG